MEGWGGEWGYVSVILVSILTHVIVNFILFRNVKYINILNIIRIWYMFILYYPTYKYNYDTW